jgi:hypothetical protein
MQRYCTGKGSTESTEGTVTRNVLRRQSNESNARKTRNAQKGRNQNPKADTATASGFWKIDKWILENRQEEKKHTKTWPFGQLRARFKSRPRLRPCSSAAAFCMAGPPRGPSSHSRLIVILPLGGSFCSSGERASMSRRSCVLVMFSRCLCTTRGRIMTSRKAPNLPVVSPAACVGFWHVMCRERPVGHC